MAPPPRLIMWGCAAFIPHHVAQITDLSVLSSIASVFSSRRTLGVGTNALFTRISRPPKRSTAPWTADSRLALSVTSVFRKSDSAPSCVHSAATAAPDSGSISAMTTLAPSRAKRRATPRPIPPPAPVIRPILSCKSPIDLPDSPLFEQVSLCWRLAGASSQWASPVLSFRRRVGIASTGDRERGEVRSSLEDDFHHF